MPLISSAQIRQQLHDLSVLRGAVLLVHSAFSRIGPVEGGPAGLIRALEDAIGPDGTLVMPSMTDDDEHLFDPHVTPCRSLGVVPDTFWRLPGVLRSSNPHAFAAKGPAAPYITADHPLDFPHGPNSNPHAFAAKGPTAPYITADHPLDVPHGPDSPVGRVHEVDGLVLLLGVGHDANTTVHLAECLAGVRYRRPKHVTVLQGGQPVSLRYLEIDHCCQNFCLVDDWLDSAHVQRHGPVGHAEARLVRSRAIVDIVTAHLRLNETAFLHPYGIDSQCDEARDSLAAL